MKTAWLALPWLMSAAVAHSQCLQEKLISPTPSIDGYFGSGLGLDGDLLAVGSSFADGAAPNSGTVYLYRRAGLEWQLDATLNASDGASFDYFGETVDASAGRVAVGSAAQRAVYLFEEQPSGWGEVAKVEPSEAQQVFGRSFDLLGDVLVVGAERDEQVAVAGGAAFVFERGPSGWTQVQKLIPSDLELGDQFGVSVELDGDRLCIGALAGNGVVADTGAVYVFERVGGAWIETAKVFAADGKLNDYFGAHFSVALDGDRLMVGASRVDDFCPQNPNCNSGAVYVFENSSGSWNQVARLTSPSPKAFAAFGWDLELQGGQALISSPYGGTVQEGQVFLLENSPLGWLPKAGLGPLGTETFGLFGTLKLQGTQLIVGAERDGEVASESGSVYSYDLDANACPNLVGAPTTVSLSEGGAQVLLLNAGASHGGELFALLGSLSGTSPGLVLDGLTLPLQVDAYFSLTLSGSAPFSGSPGFLDGLGRAQVAVEVPAGTLPPLLGLTAHHAFLTLDLSGTFPVVSFTSAAESLQLIP
jgi:hypothetical protein